MSGYGAAVGDDEKVLDLMFVHTVKVLNAPGLYTLKHLK